MERTLLVSTVPDVLGFEMNADGSMTLYLRDSSEVLIRDAQVTVPAMVESVLRAHRRRADVIADEMHAAASRVIEIPHPEIEMQVALMPDVSPAEALQAMRQLSSPTSVTIPLEIAPSVKTMADFFGEDQARSNAEQMAKRLFCNRCDAGAMKLIEKFPGRWLCAACAPLEI